MYFNELNITVYSMLSAKNVFVLTESWLRADGLSRNWTWHNTQNDVKSSNEINELIDFALFCHFLVFGGNFQGGVY